MNLLGNLLWLVFGGLVTAIEYVVASVILMVTIIGFPFGLQTLKLASLAIWPFGADVEYSRDAGCLSVLMNILWIFLGGIWICLTHFVFAIILFITIIGIPFAKQHIKLAGLALTPFGRTVVRK